MINVIKYKAISTMGDNILEYEFEKYPISLLTHPNLDSNKKFMYLKDCLKKYYKLFFLDRKASFYVHKTKALNKQLHQSLHLLLAELVMTKNTKDQLETLEKVYNWYESVLKKPISSPVMNSIKLPPCIKIPSWDFNSKTPVKVHKAYTPIKKEESQEDLNEILTQKHNEMLRNEKIQFSTSGIRRNLSHNVRVPFETPKSIAKLEETDTMPSLASKSPGIMLEKHSKSPIFLDFRPISHKTRIIAASKLSKQFNTQFPPKTREIAQVFEIKSKLAQKGLIISTNSLENSLYTHHQIPYENLTHDTLPKGGEYLIQGIPKPKKSSKSLVLKEAKKSPKNNF